LATRSGRASPTARELEVARLVGLGLTNKEIARRLGISERTVGAHIQNLLNKLGASNRAQIVALSAHSDAPLAPSPRVRSVAAPNPRSSQSVLIALALVLCVVFPADHVIQPPAAAAEVSVERGDLVFEAHFYPDGREFGLRYVIGDPEASAVRFVDSAVEFSILKPDGNTGNRLAIEPTPAFFAEYEMSVKPQSDVVFWINFAADDPARYPLHQIVIQTGIEAMQLAYDTGEAGPSLPLGPQVSIDRMLTGRHFTISTLVAPPTYRVFLDGVRVIDVKHDSVRRMQTPTFSIFGNGGTVRISALRVYRVEVTPT
jgi:DNA-binding CsgD family transcriptional regulator